MDESLRDAAITRALSNVCGHGDTDVLPFPFESLFFRDQPQESFELIKKCWINTENKFKISNLPKEHLITNVGKTGFRRVTHIDPIWNAYYLSLVIYAGKSIEAVRLPAEDKTVHSYRFDSTENKASLFKREFNYQSFELRSRDLAVDGSFVVSADISDFYGRIYHHRLENALIRTGVEKPTVRRILECLTEFSDGTSYGLPVGGPGSRLLSELVLNAVDRMLVVEGIKFVRFSDDYRLFAKTESEAHKLIRVLAEKLTINEGLTLQKQKTVIQTSGEYKRTLLSALEPELIKNKNTRNFLSMRLLYDPYSDTAKEDFEKITEEIENIDILDVLKLELAKTVMHKAIAKKALSALHFSSDQQKRIAIRLIADNLVSFYPIFQTALLTLRSLLKEAVDDDRQYVFSKLQALISDDHYVFGSTAMKLFACQIISDYNSIESDMVLRILLRDEESLLSKKLYVCTLTSNQSRDLLSNELKRFRSSAQWAQRALVVASFELDDEGEHWRKKNAPKLGEFEKLLLDWRKSRSTGWKLTT